MLHNPGFGFNEELIPLGAAYWSRLAQSSGLNAQRAAEILNSDECAIEVRESEQFFQSQGIHSVPAIIINDRHLIRIINEVSGINRVTCDVSSKPSATIESE